MSLFCSAFSRLGVTTFVMLVTIVCMGLPSAAFAAGGGGGGGGGGAALEGGGGSGNSRAIAAYKKGESRRNRGIELLQEAAETEDADAKTEFFEKAVNQFERSAREYKKATRRDRKFHQAFNGLGFAQRMVGLCHEQLGKEGEAKQAYEDALAAYDKALELEPGFPHAIEYRGEAYMRLGRLDDAKAAYMELFADHRKLADMLMKKMRAWVALQKQRPSKIPADQIQSFSTWVDERAKIADQTAALVDGATPQVW